MLLLNMYTLSLSHLFIRWLLCLHGRAVCIVLGTCMSASVLSFCYLKPTLAWGLSQSFVFPPIELSFSHFGFVSNLCHFLSLFPIILQHHILNQHSMRCPVEKQTALEECWYLLYAGCISKPKINFLKVLVKLQPCFFISSM